MSREGNGAGEGSGAPAAAEGAGGGLSLAKRRLRGTFSLSTTPWRVEPGGGQALFPGNKGQGERKLPKVVPGEVQIRYQEKTF